MFTSYRSRRAFAFIELPLVIALLAIVAAILFPVFAQARAKARQSACQSNMKQLGWAILMYAEDHDGRVPPSLNYGMHRTLRSAWPQIIYPYVGKETAYICPERRGETDRLDSNRFAAPTAVSYAYNLSIGGIMGKSDADLKLTQFRSPRATVILTESAPSSEYLETPIHLAQARDIPSLSTSLFVAGGPQARHAGNKRANVLFADGHIKSLLVESFYTGADEMAEGETQKGYSPCLDPERGCPSLSLVAPPAPKSERFVY